MTTLRDLWIAKGMTSTEVAGRAGISTPTLYKMNRREGDVYPQNIVAVCKVLGISRADYDQLSPCLHADKYKGQ